MKNKYFSILSVLYLNQLYEKLKPGFKKDFVFQEIDYKKMYLPKNVSLYDSTQIMDSNPIKTAIVVCNKLIKEQVRPYTCIKLRRTQAWKCFRFTQ